MPRALLDENVSLQVADRLSTLGYDVLSVARLPERGLSDQAVFDRATREACLLITRDAHFTNPIRFPPTRTAGILFITPGNLRGREEAELVAQFLQRHPADVCAGRLVFLSPAGVWIR